MIPPSPLGFGLGRGEGDERQGHGGEFGFEKKWCF